MRFLLFTEKQKKRDYRKEYDEYHSKPEQVKNRQKRNEARRLLGLKKGDKREVDHKVPLSKGGSNSKKNLRAVSRTTNRKKHAKT
jgi:5-methylcytosine-specific restriction endonuclease McrA